MSDVSKSRRARTIVLMCLGSLLFAPAIAHAQTSPWERMAATLAIAFTGPMARSFSLVAIVVGGLMWMFGEGGGKRALSGLIFGLGMTMFAASFLSWITS